MLGKMLELATGPIAEIIDAALFNQFGRPSQELVPLLPS